MEETTTVELYVPSWEDRLGMLGPLVSLVSGEGRWWSVQGVRACSSIYESQRVMVGRKTDLLCLEARDLLRDVHATLACGERTSEEERRVQVREPSSHR